MTGSHHLHQTVCDNCSIDAYAKFDPPNQKFLGWGQERGFSGGCGLILCTGKNNYLIHDWDGDFLGAPGILLANNSVIGDNTNDCTYNEFMNGHHCTRQDLGVLEYESIAPDFNTRIMWPVYLEYDGSNYKS